MSEGQRFQAILTAVGFRVQRLADGELIGGPYASRFRAQQVAADLDEAEDITRSRESDELVAKTGRQVGGEQ